MSEPCGLFLWRRGHRSGPSLEYWGGVVVPSDPVHRGSPGNASEWTWRRTCKPLWTDCARGRDLVDAEAGTAVGGVSAGTNPKIAEAPVYSAEALSGRRVVGAALGHSGR